MKTMLCSAAAMTLAVLLCAPVQAAPASPTVGAPAAVAFPIVPVAGGCGFGEHRGPLGGCVLNDSPAGVVRGILGPGNPGPRRVCPPGTHLGPAGERCVPNTVAPIRVCPPGTHPGPAGERCIPNAVAPIRVCPPGTHPGPAGQRCLPN